MDIIINIHRHWWECGEQEEDDNVNGGGGDHSHEGPGGGSDKEGDGDSDEEARYQLSILFPILNKDIEIVHGNIKINETVNDLTLVVKDLKKLSLSEENINKEVFKVGDVKTVLRSCRSVTEIETKVPEFQYNEDRQEVVNSYTVS